MNTSSDTVLNNSSISMTTLSKPLLHPGFLLRPTLSVETRLERAFFTEVYSLSDGRFLYLFTEIQAGSVVDRHKQFELVTVQTGGRKYIGTIEVTHSHERMAQVIDGLTVVRGLDCVGGMGELKALLANDVIGPLRNPEKYKKFKVPIPNGILLYGPPGCGKTFIVTKLAEELGYTFIELKPSLVATPYVHGAVGNIGRVFELARAKAPSIVFIDEMEGLVPKREELGSYAETKKEEINEFLLQLNNAGKSSGVLVVGATNRPQMIDTAIMRSGRMDKHIYVPPPDHEARKEMFALHLSGRPCAEGIDPDALATLTDHYVSSDVELIVNEAARAAVARSAAAIDMDLLEETIARVRPSVNADELATFEEFEKFLGREGGSSKKEAFGFAVG